MLSTRTESDAWKKLIESEVTVMVMYSLANGATSSTSPGKGYCFNRED
jgi:hypothetical protein